MIFCIFSYNRGEYLGNCISSIEKCIANPDIRVFDDNSNDLNTLDVLADIRKKYKVILPSDHSKQSKHGGLYGNMQHAVDNLPETACACFLQDDMQLVRPVEQAEINEIYAYFEHYKSAVFLHPSFLKLVNDEKDAKEITLSNDGTLYTSSSLGNCAGRYYSDIFITQIGRLKQSGWQFENREKLNQVQAKDIFDPMHFMVNPFLMWLPNAACYRGKKKSVALQWAEKRCKADLYPIKIMSSEESKAFLMRDKCSLPVAEKYLSLVAAKLPEPWIYYPLQGRKFLQKLNSIELLLRK
jgi:glycosyltransferase involved in cell wall biosynthesis